MGEEAETHNAMVLMCPRDTIARSPLTIRQPRGKLIPVRIRDDREAVTLGESVRPYGVGGGAGHDIFVVEGQGLEFGYGGNVNFYCSGRLFSLVFTEHKGGQGMTYRVGRGWVAGGESWRWTERGRG